MGLCGVVSVYVVCVCACLRRHACCVSVRVWRLCMYVCMWQSKEDVIVTPFCLHMCLCVSARVYMCKGLNNLE